MTPYESFFNLVLNRDFLEHFFDKITTEVWFSSLFCLYFIYKSKIRYIDMKYMNAKKKTEEDLRKIDNLLYELNILASENYYIGNIFVSIFKFILDSKKLFVLDNRRFY